MAGSTSAAQGDEGHARRILNRMVAVIRVRTAPLRAELAPRLRATLTARTRALLEPRATVLAEARADADAVRTALLGAERHVAAAIAGLDDGPFVATMTVHAAHARHAGVGRVFAGHGLPRCLDCAVGADETLAEAASGEGLPLLTLLEELNALLLACR